MKAYKILRAMATLFFLASCTPTPVPVIPTATFPYDESLTPSVIFQYTPELTVAFQVAVKNGFVCYYDIGGGQFMEMRNSKLKEVGVVGKDSSGKWRYVNIEGTTACWVETVFLESEGDANSLPTMEINPPIPTLLPSPLPPPDLGITDTPSFVIKISGDLRVDILQDTIVCECNGRYGKVHIKIFFLNGTPSFTISGQNPVNEPKAEFDVPLGSGDLNLILTSSDGLKWEGIVKIPSTCEPTDDCGGQGPKTPEPPPVTQCNDGKDNDFDQKVDYPEDPGCDDKSDNSEWPFNWP